MVFLRLRKWLPTSHVRWSRVTSAPRTILHQTSFFKHLKPSEFQSWFLEENGYVFHFYSLNRIETFVFNSGKVLYFISSWKPSKKSKIFSHFLISPRSQFILGRKIYFICFEMCSLLLYYIYIYIYMLVLIK